MECIKTRQVVALGGHKKQQEQEGRKGTKWKRVQLKVRDIREGEINIRDRKGRDVSGKNSISETQKEMETKI